MAERGGADAGGGRREAGGGRARRWLYGLLPLVLLAGLVAVFTWSDPMGFLQDRFPPVEELTVTRVTFPEPGRMTVRVTNGGPEPVTVAQLQVDEAYWQHEVRGSRTIPRLESRTIDVPYPWVSGEPHEITLVSSNGITFTHEVEVATETPQAGTRYFAIFGLLGVYAGLVPVLIGLFWYPFLRDMRRKWLDFFLAFTVGLLVFLGVDGLHEALEVAGRVPEAFQGVGLVALGVLGALLGLRAVGPSREEGGTDERAGRLRLAYLIALGIGLHNLGEGLAIGSAYTSGELALGSFLVIGFALHNTTEGLGIVAPVARDRPSLWHLAAMGAVAGLPTVAGTWIGGFAYSPSLTALFLALGVGAIFQVAWEISGVMARRGARGLLRPLNAAGVGLGLVVMYATALFVVA